MPRSCERTASPASTSTYRISVCRAREWSRRRSSSIRLSSSPGLRPGSLRYCRCRPSAPPGATPTSDGRHRARRARPARSARPCRIDSRYPPRHPQSGRIRVSPRTGGLARPETVLARLRRTSTAELDDRQKRRAARCRGRVCVGTTPAAREILREPNSRLVAFAFACHGAATDRSRAAASRREAKARMRQRGRVSPAPARHRAKRIGSLGAMRSCGRESCRFRGRMRSSSTTS
jgi:hypothetical protein